MPTLDEITTMVAEVDRRRLAYDAAARLADKTRQAAAKAWSYYIDGHTVLQRMTVPTSPTDDKQP